MGTFVPNNSYSLVLHVTYFFQQKKDISAQKQEEQKL